MEIEVVKVNRENKEVTVLIKGIDIYITFMKVNGKILPVSRWSYNLESFYIDSLWVPRSLYIEAVKKAAAILNEKRSQINKPEQILFPF